MKKRFVILVAQLPLVVAFQRWWNQIQEWLVIAVLLAVAYEVFVFALAFGMKVWDEIEKDAIKATADWVRTWVFCIAPGFRRRYKRHVTERHRVLNVLGLVILNTPLDFDQVFVQLQTDCSNPQKFNLDPIAHEDIVGNRPIWDFLRREKAHAEKAFAWAIVGPPGSGKTTLLKHIALTFAKNRQHHYRMRAFTPILLFLREHVKTITQAEPPPLGKLVQDYFGNIFSTLKPLDSWFERELERGKCIVLLDGLDELADVEQRRAVSIWVDNQIINYPCCRFVLTARPQGYKEAPLQRASVLKVLSFNAKQVQGFVESWYLADPIRRPGNLCDADVRDRASQNADATDLLQLLRNHPSIGALAVNPLLLTLIAIVHSFRGRLPSTRVELYVKICEVLLGRWRQTSVQDKLNSTQKLVVLRPLAAYLMGNKKRDIDLDTMLSIIAGPLASVGIAVDVVENFPPEIQSASGLLLEREAGQWSFVHPTFQEFLTARHWLKQKIQPDWKALIGDSWWHETLRFYAAQGDATTLVTACLEVDTVEALALCC